MGIYAFNVLGLTFLLGLAACSSDDIQDEALVDDDQYLGEEVTVPDTVALDPLDWEAVNLPPEPDYSDPTMWYIQPAQLGAQVDVFYTCPTVVIMDYFYNWRNCGHMNVYDDNQRKEMKMELERAAAAYGVTANFYSYYYRQMTMQSFVSESSVAQRFPYAFQDVKRAFNYFLEHYSQGKPFIIAGYSQGGKATVELVKALSPSLKKRLVAAYVMGYKVTAEDLEQSPNIVPATGATDVGVTCCFSSVGDEASIWPIIQSPVACGINPINWKTDDTPAVIPWVTGEDPTKPVTVHKDLTHNIMFVENYGVYDFGFYPVTWIMGKYNYHPVEYDLYSPALTQNVADRIVAFQCIPTGIRPIKW